MVEHVTLDNPCMRIVVDGTTGALREIVHKQAGLALIAAPERAARHPFMIVLDDGTTLRTWTQCAVMSDVGAAGAVTVRWTVERGLELTARLHVDDTSGDLRCRVTLANPRDLPVAALAYPYIAGIGRLGDAPDDDELAHPYATGFLVRNPLDHLPPVTSETEAQEPIALGLYPEGFSGSTMQFMAYSAAGRGGFYIATEDGLGREKWLNFYRHPEGDLRLSIWHSPSSRATRGEIAVGYPIVLAALDGGTWYDAAERYKAWVTRQAWVAQGPLWDRDDRCRWLLDRVGLCTFGINARHSRAAWLAAIDRIAGTPVLHLLGPNWSRLPADYRDNLPGGLADWFPASFDPDNLAVIRQNHDYLVPFEFDLLFGRGVGQTEEVAGTRALQVFPQPTLSRDEYRRFPYLCPACAFTRALHIARDRALVEEWPVDGIYYDISLNNVRHICLSDAHEHRPGDTGAITSAYRDLLTATGGAMRDAAGGTPLPQGSELINEQMLPVLSFYQARAEASPAAPFEAAPFRALIKAGKADKIPLFAYVYHEYGPVRLDGWAKLSREQGDYVYFILGRVFLQGGLIELNYEFSALEDVDGHHDAPDEHYFPFDDRHYAIDPRLAEFVGHLARARVGRANRYLAYGTMRRPAPLTVQGDTTLDMEYFSYNCGQTFPEYEDRGTMRVPTVLQGAWRHREESAAWLLLNLATEERVATLTLTPALIGIASSSSWQLTLHREDGGGTHLGTLDGRRDVRLSLPPRHVVMIEATRLV